MASTEVLDGKSLDDRLQQMSSTEPGEIKGLLDVWDVEKGLGHFTGRYRMDYKTGEWDPMAR
ncbi:hypothetical protein HYV84_03240 [Candidatus Woesearchaeota archaeon]|nr:hypothetical protein [Candidatus Woesearchaeota archaeon]